MAYKHDFTIYEEELLKQYGFDLENFDEKQQEAIGKAFDNDMDEEDIPNYIIDEVMMMGDEEYLKQKHEFEEQQELEKYEKMAEKFEANRNDDERMERTDKVLNDVKPDEEGFVSVTEDIEGIFK